MARHFLYDGDTFTHNDRSFRVTWDADLDTGAPWEECDGHGIVSDWTPRSKRPGERVLATDRSLRRYYDMAATLVIARRDGWGTGDGRKPGEKTRAYTARAVDADFEYCRGWATDAWHYIGITVTSTSDPDVSTSLWGVEDFDPAYTSSVARDLADELCAQMDRNDALAAEQARLALAAEFGFGA